MQQYLRHRNDGERKPPLPLPLKKAQKSDLSGSDAAGYSPPPVYLDCRCHTEPQNAVRGQWDYYERVQSAQPSVRQILWANFPAVYAGVKLGGTKGCLRETCARYYNRSLAAVPFGCSTGAQSKTEPAIKNQASNLSIVRLQHTVTCSPSLSSIDLLSLTLIVPCNINERHIFLTLKRIYTVHQYLMMLLLFGVSNRISKHQLDE